MNTAEDWRTPPHWINDPHFSESKVHPRFLYSRDQVKHPNIAIGAYTYGAPLVQWLFGKEQVRIGKFCSIATGVEMLMNGNHPIESLSSYPFAQLGDLWPGALNRCPTGKGDLIVGNDVWIGKDATIFGGVTVGDGAVIGAQAVVAKDVPPYAVVVGNPARIVRYRFDPETIATLLELQWWNWDDARIRRSIPAITGNDVQKLRDSV